MNLLNEASDSKFVTRKLNISNDQSNANYDVGSKIIHNTEIQVHSIILIILFYSWNVGSISGKWEKYLRRCVNI